MSSRGWSGWLIGYFSVSSAWLCWEFGIIYKCHLTINHVSTVKKTIAMTLSNNTVAKLLAYVFYTNYSQMDKVQKPFGCKCNFLYGLDLDWPPCSCMTPSTSQVTENTITSSPSVPELQHWIMASSVIAEHNDVTEKLIFDHLDIKCNPIIIFILLDIVIKLY